MTHHPIDQETRGRLRVWKAAIAAQYASIERLSRTDALATDASDFAFKRPAGRARCLRRLEQRLTACGGVIPYGRITEGRHPVALWATLKPREPSLHTSPDPSEQQPSVSVNFLAIGNLPAGNCFADGLWGLVIPDHALGRLMQRRRDLNPATAIIDAHRTLLRLRHADLETTSNFLLRAGPGAFICDWRILRTPARRIALTVRATTWLDNDQLYDNQTPLLGDGTPGDRLGDGLLAPPPFIELSLKPNGRGQAQLSLWRHFNPALVFDCA